MTVMLELTPDQEEKLREESGAAGAASGETCWKRWYARCFRLKRMLLPHFQNALPASIGVRYSG